LTDGFTLSSNGRGARAHSAAAYERANDYGTSRNAKIYQMKIVNGEWTSPVQPNFASDSIDNSPVYSRDGNTLYFFSRRDRSPTSIQVKTEPEVGLLTGLLFHQSNFLCLRIIT
jgi:tricorn protease-like protein